MRAEAERSRFGLLLALLLVLSGLTAGPTTAAAPSTGPTFDTSRSASIYEGRHDLRLSSAAPQSVTTALPNTSWAVRAPATDATAPYGWTSVREPAATWLTATTTTTRSSRGPPAA